MRVGVLTREYPPDVYGGAGVHVDFLVRELRRLVDVDVHCFGAPREGAVAHATPAGLAGANAALQTLGVDLEIAGAVAGCDVLHSHTWYANVAGVLGGQLHGVPHVLTAHSLEPQRPWKVEQLGGGYRVSSWAERTAYRNADAVIAVSHGMKADVLAVYPFMDPDKVHVVHNGIDTGLYQPDRDTDVLERHGVDPDRPYVVFVGRITRQKGVGHLLAAARAFVPEAQLVLCAGAPDTAGDRRGRPRPRSRTLRESRSGRGLDLRDAAPAGRGAAAHPRDRLRLPVGVRAAGHRQPGGDGLRDRGGGQRGRRHPRGRRGRGDRDAGAVHGDLPGGLRGGLADAVNALVTDPDRAAEMGRAGRARAVREFGWDAVARRTVDVYSSLL